jgi:competence protein ComEA
MKFSIHDLGFTKSEARILILAFTVLTVGFCIKYYDSVFGVSDSNNFDFTRSDMEFKLKSSEVSKGNNSLDGNNSVININTAGIEELVVLDGIGDSLAAEIISYRDKHGKFSKPEDIMKVSGIGKKKFEKIKDKIKIK